MKYLFIILALLSLSINSNAQKSISVTDSLKTEIKALKASINDFKRSNDSIAKEVNKNLVKVEFYVGRYSDLSTQFQWFTGILVTFIVAIGGVVVWKFYQNDMKKVKRQIKLYDKKLKILLTTIKKKFDDNEYHLSNDMVLNRMETSILYLEENQPLGIKHMLGALQYAIKAYNTCEEKDKQVTKELISQILNHVKKYLEVFDSKYPTMERSQKLSALNLLTATLSAYMKFIDQSLKIIEPDIDNILTIKASFKVQSKRLEELEAEE